MAIAFDAATPGGFTVGTSHSFSHVGGSGADRILFVMAWGGVGVASDVTGVTYNTEAMTKIGEVANETSIRNVSLWYLVAPATGSNTVAITGTGGLTDACGGAASSYTGASQTGVPDSFGTAFVTSGATLTASTTVVAANCWLTGGGQNGGGACSAGAGTIMRVADANSENYGDSNGTVGTGSQSLTMDDAGGQTMALVIASFAPAGALEQIARPESDVSSGSWTPSTGSDLFATIDEVVTDDADYNRSGAAPVNDTMEVQLEPLTTPEAGDVTLTIRHRTVH